MSELKEAFTSIKTIKKAIEYSEHNISNFYKIFLLLGLNNLFYFIFENILIYYNYFNGIIPLTYFKFALNISIFVYCIILTIKEENFYNKRINLILGTCLFIIPFIYYIANVILRYIHNASITSTANEEAAYFSLFNQSTMLIVITFCAILFIINYKDNFRIQLFSCLLLIVLCIAVTLMSYTNWQISFHNDLNDSTFSLPLNGLYNIFLTSLGYIYIALYLKKRKGV